MRRGICKILVVFPNRLVNLKGSEFDMSQGESVEQLILSNILPFLIRSMDTKHTTALMYTFRNAFHVTVSDEEPTFITSVRISLWLLAKIVNEPTELCSQTREAKDKNSYRAGVAQGTKG
jgi:hypothetical protein